MNKKSPSDSIGLLQGLMPDLPHNPGVYLFKDSLETVIYVGKARDLKKRLASYARMTLDRDAKTSLMLARVANLETILTSTEKEALILESSLIKKYRPKYNVILRDDKNYPLLKVTVKETYPRLVMTRKRINDGARYFGPFSSAAAMWETVKYIHALFPLRRCKVREIKKIARPCLNFQMGKCLAPCTNKVDQKAYAELVRNVLLVLDGKSKEVLRLLREEMAARAESLNFEEAARCRDRITAIEKTLEKQSVVFVQDIDLDVFGFGRREAAVAVSVVLVRIGRVEGQRSFFLPGPLGKDNEILAEVVCRFYGDDGRPLPHEVLLPFEADGERAIEEWLTEAAGHRVRVFLPCRGKRRDLLRLANNNAEQVLLARGKKEEAWQFLSLAIKEKLGLGRVPERIECLDISNLSGGQAVGGLVVFFRGEPEKSAYRHYKIREISGPDDYAMMDEVLRRRFGKARALPDLLVLDGGKGQLNVANEVLTGLGIHEGMELLSIAKERDDEGERLYRPGRKNPLSLPAHSPVLLFFMRVRDEAHRHGITFHRKWRSRETLRSALDSIPGVGPARRKALLTRFGGIAGVRSASVEQLAEIPRIGPELAKEIWAFFHD